MGSTSSLLTSSVNGGSFTSTLIRELNRVKYSLTAVTASVVPLYVDITPSTAPTRVPTMSPSKKASGNSAMPTATPRIQLIQVK